MKRNWMIGAAVSLLVAASLLAVGIGAYRAGQRHGGTVEVLTTGESAGRTLVVPVETWRGGWHGGPGFLLFPLIVIGLILLFSSRRRGGWSAGCGAGRGRGWSTDDEHELQDWHRRAHADAPAATPERTPDPNDGR